MIRGGLIGDSGMRVHVKMGGGGSMSEDVSFWEKKHGPQTDGEIQSNIKYLCVRGVVGNLQAKYINEMGATNTRVISFSVKNTSLAKLFSPFHNHPPRN